MVDRLVAVIPARAGSKGLPGKNWLELEGKSLVQRAIETALACPGVKDVALSSDDPRATELAALMGIDFVPRTPFAGSDSATASDVIRDVISKWHPAQADSVHFLYLQPTSPLRRVTHVTDAIESMVSAGFDASVSVVESPVCGFKMLRMSRNGALEALFGDEFATGNRGVLPTTYLANGAIYIFSRESFEEHQSIPISGALPFVMSMEDSIDIDTLDDWVRVLQTLEGESTSGFSPGF